MRTDGQRTGRNAQRAGRRKAAAGLFLAALLCLMTGCGSGPVAVPTENNSTGDGQQVQAEVVSEAASAEEMPAEQKSVPDSKTDTAEESPDSLITAAAEESPAENAQAGQEETQEPASAVSTVDPEETESSSDGQPLDAQEEPSQNESTEDDTELFLQNMSLEAKVAQMFVILPEQLTGVAAVTQAGETTRAALMSFPVGGLLYMEGSLENYIQTKQLLADTQQLSYEITGLPMLTLVDEEGGIVRRISGTFPEVPEIESMAALGSRGSTEEAFQTGRTIGGYLSDLGFNCDCAPVADVLTNPENTVIGERSFGPDPQLVADMASALGSGLESEGVTAIYKHFPGHGGTADDSHDGYTYLDKTIEELYDCELIPFIRAIENGAKMIMAAHISLPNIVSEDLPASLNYEILTGLLRGELGFQGVIITDAMNMGAIANRFTSGEAAVLAIHAGADLILMPMDPYAAYQQVLSAVEAGEISEERINESVRMILQLKRNM